MRTLSDEELEEILRISTSVIPNSDNKAMAAEILQLREQLRITKETIRTIFNLATIEQAKIDALEEMDKK